MVAGLTLPAPAAVGDEWGNALNVAIHSVNADVEAIKARTITAGLGLTGGGDLSANRAFAVDFAASGVSSATKAVRADDSRLSDARTPTAHAYSSHTGIPATFAPSAHSHAQADVTSLVSDLAAKAPTSRLVSAGSGLVGGGSLAADRTLTVDFATATPLPQAAGLGGAVGTAVKPAREDHVHPAYKVNANATAGANITSPPSVYRRDGAAFATLEGMAATAAIVAGATIFTVTSAYFPPVAWRINLYNNSTGAWIVGTVNTNGAVVASNNIASGNTFYCSITWPVA